MTAEETVTFIRDMCATTEDHLGLTYRETIIVDGTLVAIAFNERTQTWAYRRAGDEQWIHHEGGIYYHTILSIVRDLTNNPGLGHLGNYPPRD